MDRYGSVFLLPFLDGSETPGKVILKYHVATWPRVTILPFPFLFLFSLMVYAPCRLYIWFGFFLFEVDLPNKKMKFHG